MSSITSGMTSIYNPAIKYRSEIDGLRAIAVLPVILFHARFGLFSGGYVGVDVFFVISGYLITSIILRELADGRFSIIQFYERRARRILPALLFILFCCIPLARMWLLPEELRRFGQSIVAVATFSANAYFWLKTDYFAPDAENAPLLHTWSLAVEEQYYVLFPVFLMLCWRFGRARLFWLTAAVATVSFLLCEWGWRNDAVFNFYMLPMRAWELLVGSLIAFLHSSRVARMMLPWAVRQLLPAVGLGAIVFSMLAFDSATPFPSYYALAPTLGTGLIIMFSNGRDVTGRLLSTRPLVFVGLISYSAYLWHQPIFAFLRLRFFGDLTDLHFAAAALLSLGLATLTWHYIEKPFRKRKTGTTAGSGLDMAQVFRYSALGLGGALVTALMLIQYGSARESDIQLARDSIPKQCLRIKSLDNGKCKYATSVGGEQPVMILWGDSYADVFAPQLIAQAASESLTVYPLIMHSCPSLLGTVRNQNYALGRNFSARCSNYLLEVSELIETIRPPVVVLTSSYEKYASEANPHDGRGVLLSDDDSNRAGIEVVLVALENTVRYLNTLGAFVVIVTPHPKLDEFASQRRKAMLGVDRNALSLSPESSMRISERMIDRLQKANLDYETVSPTKFMCRSQPDRLQDCSAVDASGNYLLFDGSHISEFLGRLVAAEVLDKSGAILRN